MSTKALVTRIEVDSLSQFSVEVTITRRPSYVLTEQPDAADLPADIRHALITWLTA